MLAGTWCTPCRRRAVEHSPIWLPPLITASITDTVVPHQPISRLWTSTGVPAVLRDANALGFVDRLPQGLATLVGGRGPGSRAGSAGAWPLRGP